MVHSQKRGQPILQALDAGPLHVFYLLRNFSDVPRLRGSSTQRILRHKNVSMFLDSNSHLSPRAPQRRYWSPPPSS
jgi:hypothetical protein